MTFDLCQANIIKKIFFLYFLFSRFSQKLLYRDLQYLASAFLTLNLGANQISDQSGYNRLIESRLIIDQKKNILKLTLLGTFCTYLLILRTLQRFIMLLKHENWLLWFQKLDTRVNVTLKSAKSDVFGKQ